MGLYRSCAPPSTISFREGQLLTWGIPATGVLVETLLERGTDGDVAEAEAAIDRLAAAPADDGLVIREIWLLRLRALLARAHGDEAAYATIGIATARWRHRWASRGISPGPRRCHDDDGIGMRSCGAELPPNCQVLQWVAVPELPAPVNSVSDFRNTMSHQHPRPVGRQTSYLVAGRLTRPALEKWRLSAS